MQLSTAIEQLVTYGIETGLTPECERIYTTNLLLELFQEKNYEPNTSPSHESESSELEHILSLLLDEACKRGFIQDSIGYRDLFDTKLMNCLLPRPAQVQSTFWNHYKTSAIDATNYYYKFSQDSDYIRRYRVAKDQKWTVETKYGTLDITINLSKPEKDPKSIVAARNAQASTYPKCLLCMENEGYSGHINHPARENHRIIPLTINDSLWGFQYSPYVYYNEHCIVFNGKHIPMKIDKNTFRKLFDFVKMFPHYFLGSNADLPIVGGSILSHDHFQGGNYSFAMAKAPIIDTFQIKGYEDVTAGIVKWPLSVIRLQCVDEKRLIDLADHILETWRHYSDETAFIFAETNGQPHNTITPIVRMRNNLFEIDLALRNNITTKDHPLGVYHPHEVFHHIKKENIGLIEVMGLAVLPARLKDEMNLLKQYILEKKAFQENPLLAKHEDWAKRCILNKPHLNAETLDFIIQEEIGKVFCQVLEDAGVYKSSPEGLLAFKRFIDCL